MAQVNGSEDANQCMQRKGQIHPSEKPTSEEGLISEELTQLTELAAGLRSQYLSLAMPNHRSQSPEFSLVQLLLLYHILPWP